MAICVVTAAAKCDALIAKAWAAHGRGNHSPSLNRREVVSVNCGCWMPRITEVV
jgi:hypothetical protein